MYCGVLCGCKQLAAACGVPVWRALAPASVETHPVFFFLRRVCLNLLLTFLIWIPGMIHALYVILKGSKPGI